MVGLIIYCIGVILAFGLLSILFRAEGDREVEIIATGSLLSWVIVVLIIYERRNLSKLKKNIN